MVVHLHNTTTLEVDTGGAHIQGQIGTHETLSQMKNSWY